MIVIRMGREKTIANLVKLQKGRIDWQKHSSAQSSLQRKAYKYKKSADSILATGSIQSGADTGIDSAIQMLTQSAEENNSQSGQTTEGPYNLVAACCPG